MKKGKLIVLEGACDGIGKTTQYNLLYNRLIKEKKEVYKHHFPSYKTEQGYGVESYLKGEYGNVNDLSPYFINNLYAFDRAVTWITILKQEYEKGKIVLLDRYTTSSQIYQSALIDDIEEKNKFLDFITDYEYNKIGIQKPDKVIFLYAPFNLVTSMIEKRKGNPGIEKDIHEKDLEFMKKVYDNALYVANYFSWDIIDCSINDEMKTIEEINNQIFKIIK